jgi:hypothetical protein
VPEQGRLMRLIELREHVVEQDDRHFSARMMHDVDDRKEKRHKNRLQLAARRERRKRRIAVGDRPIIAMRTYRRRKQRAIAAARRDEIVTKTRLVAGNVIMDIALLANDREIFPVLMERAREGRSRLFENREEH